MDWTLQRREPGERFLVTAAYLAAVVLFLLLQEVGLRLRRAEQRAWWAETGRDLLNVIGCAAIGGSLWLFGFPAPAALLLGGSLTLALFGGYVFVATQTRAARPRTWAVGIGLALAVPVLLWPNEVLRASQAVVDALFSRAAR